MSIKNRMTSMSQSLFYSLKHTTVMTTVTTFLSLILATNMAAAYPTQSGFVGYQVPEVPTAAIIVHVQRKHDINWDTWQINRMVCPPSLCGGTTPLPDQALPSSARRPWGTGGSIFYQGDIILDEEFQRYIYPHVFTRRPEQSRSKRATVRLRSRLWKDGIVPYQFGSKLSAQAQRVILRAFKHITQRTCITFREREKSDSAYIRFISDPGCWSSIGRTGRRQLLSLGRGCENIGTAVHEIFHSLGVWHEQARLDRDEYVRILEENVSERFLKDFDKVTEEVSSSRGFPYDYTSVMHYSRFAFTRNGKPTIQVVGAGAERGLTLKQRNGLSSIDVAQLRDMYRCNLHTDTRLTACPEGWFKQETSCYQFFSRPKLPFPSAAEKCLDLNSHLVFIETQREDKFLANHLMTHFPSVYTWRTGGFVVNDTMKWYREDSNPEAIEYSNWGEGQPSTRTSLALFRNRRTNVTQWRGVWAGSLRSLRHFRFPFICERRARRKCLKLQHPDGRDYRGRLDHTLDGYTCQRWTDHYPHTHNLTNPATADNNDHDQDLDNVEEDDDGVGNHNFCRNPRALRRSRPWCFTTKSNHPWQLCDVSACSGSGSS